MKQLPFLTLSFLIAVIFVPAETVAQKLSKTSQSVKVNSDVTIDLNTSFCNIEFDSWNKNTVEIEAYIEGEKLSREELESALKKWKVTIDATPQKVTITTQENRNANWVFGYTTHDREAALAALEELKFELAEMPNFEFHFEVPEIPEIPEIPQLPELPEGIHQFHFDYEAYKKDGETYMEKWSQNFGENFGKEYAKKMEEWGKKFGEEFSQKFDKEWAEKFEMKMQAWAERYKEQMEHSEKIREERLKERQKHLEERQKHLEERQKYLEEEREARTVEREARAEERKLLAEERKAKIEQWITSGESSSSKVKKVIKIKMPKNAKPKVNVKHGELKFASNVSNLKADLVHTKFTANSINGSATSINASYAPVQVTHWDLGELNLKYVEEANLTHVKHLVLSSRSSSVVIDNLLSNAIINGSFDRLKVLHVAPDFLGINAILQNSDMVLFLPDTAFNLQFTGQQSFLKHPENTKKEMLKHYAQGNLSGNKNIVLNTKFSDVKLQ